MKKLQHVFLVLSVLSISFFSSCSSSDDGGGGGNAASGVLKAKIDGSSWQSLEISSSATISNGGNNLTIIATNSDGIGFSINVFGYEGVGTYNFDGDALIISSASYTETDVSNPQNPSTEIWSAPYEAGVAGSIAVSEETDSKIKGTFSFMAKNPNDDSIKNITAGSFNLNKQTQ